MYFEINVSLRGKHYFATHERSLRDEDVARNMVAHFRKVFPKNEGYRVALTRYECIGTNLDAG